MWIKVYDAIDNEVQFFPLEGPFRIERDGSWFVITEGIWSVECKSFFIFQGGIEIYSHKHFYAERRE